VAADRAGEDAVSRLVPSGGPRWLAAALAVLVLALLVTGAVLLPRWQDARAGDERRRDVLRAATAEVVAFTTLDYRDIEPSVDRVLEGATGDFEKQFEASRSQLEQLSRDNESVSEGRVLEAGVVSMDEDSATVVVVADSQVTNKSTDEPQPRHYRLQLDLVLEDGRWLTSDLQFVG
jgi:Mce-associated membrane protein